MELPVVATDVVGCTDAIEDGVTGLLVATARRRRARCCVAALCRRPDVASTAWPCGNVNGSTRMFREEHIWEALHDEYQRLM